MYVVFKENCKVDRFCPQFWAISRPRLDLNFELGWMITLINLWMLQKPFIFVICVVIPTISMKIMTRL